MTGKELDFRYLGSIQDAFHMQDLLRASAKCDVGCYDADLADLASPRPQWGMERQKNPKIFAWQFPAKLQQHVQSMHTRLERVAFLVKKLILA